MKAVEQGQK